MGLKLNWCNVAPPKQLAPVLGCAILLCFVFCTVGRATIILDDTLADGDRTNNNLPTDAAQWVGLNSTPPTLATYTVTPGKGAFSPNGSSNKLWTYFTSNQSAPDGNQPHNSVTQMSVGDTLTTSLSFRIPTGATLGTATSSSNIRYGVFFDPTDARLQSNTNTDGGGASNVWQDAQGYAVYLGFGSGLTGTEFQLGKRTNNSSTNLIATGGAYAQASKGGTAVNQSFDTDYTLQLSMNMVSATQMDVTASMYSGRPASNNLVLLTTQTVSDTGTSFGSTAVTGTGVPNNTSIYTNFDQLFFRASSNADASEIDFTEFKVELKPVPEPASMGLSVLGASGLALLAIGRRLRGMI